MGLRVRRSVIHGKSVDLCQSWTLVYLRLVAKLCALAQDTIRVYIPMFTVANMNELSDLFSVRLALLYRNAVIQVDIVILADR